ncbi:phosphoadenylyl-sulfate reductase [Pseudohongiella spirulinae]|uniref:Adenosine 5'-phosphosulfate reductase n=1 Tax=Pseudohongiella spirulinae TaxID=1249552 RepID=A0A0S2KDH3_9GAMM|nr:phosphoadenylyl-sulfate reductase [Pseudohongiella spirulinae]ALO46229.1 phosphoadenosine phosphosulfate reductase [Pseudohongiella spirulinae]
MITKDNIGELNLRFQALEPRDMLQEILTEIPDIVLSFSGAEDVALLAMAWKIKKDIRVFTLDTGRLHPQTYQFIEKVREFYQIDIEFVYPDTRAIEDLTRRKGLFSFYQDGHEECCSIRKTEPLRRQLSTAQAWITGQRRDQSPTRTDVALAQVDTTFAAPGATLLKFNPLANWTSADVWNYIRMFDIPYNPLHDQGFISIGCEPCTRPVGPNQHEREGRWWWEEATAKECGLHRINLVTEPK